MAKQKSASSYLCTECGYETSKWMGRCPSCGQWNSLSETTRIIGSGKTASSKEVREVKVKSLSEINTEANKRVVTGIGEFDRVLCGGIVEGSIVLISGEPGIGKSTLMLQACEKFSDTKKVLYVSGEESDSQIRIRADRLGLDCSKLYFLGCTDMDAVISAAKQTDTQILIIDSIQTMQTENATGTAGSVSQVRECCMLLMEYAKSCGVSVIITGHVTKDGGIAGPRILEHMVDCVLYFEGERFKTYRILRSVKNRFGSTNEIGVFEMLEKGLCEVENPSLKFLSGRTEGCIGSSVMCTMEGTRPILVELQALSVASGFAAPRRVVAGLDYNRTIMVLAVAEKMLGVKMNDQDIYINVAGGIKINEPASDLPVLLAVLSSLKNKELAPGVAAIGEVGLTGELRYVANMEKRLFELEKMGVKTCVLPYANKTEYKGKIKLVYIGKINELADSLLEGVIYERNKN